MKPASSLAGALQKSFRVAELKIALETKELELQTLPTLAFEN